MQDTLEAPHGAIELVSERLFTACCWVDMEAGFAAGIKQASRVPVASRVSCRTLSE